MDYVIEFGADADIVVTTSGRADPDGIRLGQVETDERRELEG